MGPAEGELHIAALSQHAVAGITIDLQDALEAGEVRDRPIGLAIGRVDIGHAGRIVAAPGAIITGVRPELAGLGAPSSRIEHRRRRLIGEQLGRALEHREQALVNRSQQPGGAADPVGQGRAIEIRVATIATPIVLTRVLLRRFDAQCVGERGELVSCQTRQ